MILEPRHASRHAALLFLAALAVLAIGCDHEPSNVKLEVAEIDPNATPPVVNLPDPPSADDFIIKEYHEDKTLRVQGLIEYQKKHLKKEVVVKGKVISISPDCDPGKAKKDGTKCPEPYVLIRDDEELAEKTLLVIGHRPELLKKAKVEEGGVYDFKGTYDMMARGFTASEDGLLDIAGIDDVNMADLK